MTTPNTFPAPIGIGVAFTNVRAGQTTANFVLDPGFWIISVEFDDGTANLGNDQVTLVQVTANQAFAANSTVQTMDRSGYYNFSVLPGPSLTFNFQTTNGCRNVRVTKPYDNIGPS